MMTFAGRHVGQDGEKIEKPKFEGESVTKESFQELKGEPAKPFKPKIAVHVGRLPFEGSSVYKDSYLEMKPDLSEATISTKMLQRSIISMGEDAKFQGESVSRSDFMGLKGTPSKPFVPPVLIHAKRLPFEGGTETKEAFVPREFVKSKPTISTKKLQRSVIAHARGRAKFEGASESKSAFLEKEIEHTESFAPKTQVHVGRYKFDGGSVYADTFLKKEFDRSVAARKKEEDFGGMH